jgi:hypothetical protein
MPPAASCAAEQLHEDGLVSNTSQCGTMDAAKPTPRSYCFQAARPGSSLSMVDRWRRSVPHELAGRSEAFGEL